MVDNKTITKRINVNEIPYLKMWTEDGILYCVYNDKLEIDLEIAKQCVANRIEFSEGESYPVWVNMKGVKSATKSAREYLADEGSYLVKAGALVIGSPLTRILGNVFLLVNKPKVPTRIFTDEEQATEWLRQYI